MGASTLHRGECTLQLPPAAHRPDSCTSSKLLVGCTEEGSLGGSSVALLALAGRNTPTPSFLPCTGCADRPSAQAAWL